MGGILESLQAVNWQTLLLGAALGGLSSAVALLVRTVIQQPVKALTEQSRVITALSFLSQQQPFKGQWTVVWHVDSDRYPSENIDTVQISRLFSNVAFTTSAKLNDGSHQSCVFVGKLLDRSVTGRWFNPEDQERGYFGAFQFKIHGSLRSAEGMWIGWRNDGTVASGRMTLTRAN